MTEPGGVLQLFTKAPRAGHVKTRLVPILGSEGAAALHERLIRRSAQVAEQSSLAEVQIWTDDAAHPLFQELYRAHSWQLHVQTGADLGARMAGALCKGLSDHPFAVLIGTDSPSLTAADVDEAAGCLEAGIDAVLAPAEDGGYVLLGLQDVRPELFEDIAWGAGTVMQATRARLRELGWRWHELATQWDVDRPADLRRLERLRGAG